MEDSIKPFEIDSKMPATPGFLIGSSGFKPGKLKSSLISFIGLSYWDNIMGPVVAKLWKGNEKVPLTKEILSFVSNHTLSGELCRQTERNTIDPKFYVLPDLGYIFFAVIFSGTSKLGETIWSLSFVMACSDLDKYLLLQEFIYQQVSIMVLKYRVLQKKNFGSSVPAFGSDLKAFVQAVDYLEVHSLPAKICIEDTVFGTASNIEDLQLLDQKFLMSSVTSHLQTGGSTVVIGRSHEQVNLMISTLALFLTESERYCSALVPEGDKRVFQRDLWLQGLVLESDSTVNPVASRDLLLNSNPVTFVDVDRKTVKQTIILNEHYSTRKEILKCDLSSLFRGEESPVYQVMTLSDVGEISCMAQRFVSEIFAVPNKCALRQTYVENFKATLQHKAKSLLSYIESKSSRGRERMDQTQLRQLQHDLGLVSNADFLLVLAAAEKMRRGLCAFLLGDPHQLELENKGSDVSYHFSMWR